MDLRVLYRMIKPFASTTDESTMMKEVKSGLCELNRQNNKILLLVMARAINVNVSKMDSSNDILQKLIHRVDRDELKEDLESLKSDRSDPDKLLEDLKKVETLVRRETMPLRVRGVDVDAGTTHVLDLKHDSKGTEIFEKTPMKTAFHKGSEVSLESLRENHGVDAGDTMLITGLSVSHNDDKARRSASKMSEVMDKDVVTLKLADGTELKDVNVYSSGKDVRYRLGVEKGVWVSKILVDGVEVADDKMLADYGVRPGPAVMIETVELNPDEI